MEMQNRRRAGRVEEEGRRRPQLGGSGRRQSGRAVRQRQQEHVIVRAVRKMKLVGLRQALKPGTSLLESLFWVGVFCVCVWYTVHLTWTSVEEYLNDPTSNAFHDDANINFVPFPGVTVTGTMTFTSSGIEEVTQKYINPDNEANDEKSYGNISWTAEGIKILLFTVDHFCEMVSSFASRFSFLDFTKTLDLKAIENWVRKQNVTLRDDPTDPIMRDQVMPFIRDNTLNCKSILLACMWEGTKENCDDLFVPVQTDVGVGCSFNRIPEEILRTTEGLMSLLRNRTTRISQEEWSDWKKWDMDVDLKSAIERLKSPRRFPRNQNAAGNMKGLSFLLLHDDLDKFSCPIMSSNGFLVGIHSPFEEPQMMKSGVSVPPGYEVLIKVKGELTIADKALQSLAIEKRNCLFQGETKLKQFSTYTLANCQKECLSTRISSKCGCHQLSMSSGNNETICGPLDVVCVRNATRELDQDGYNQLCGDLKCLAPCNDINYETSVSYLPYHSKNIFDFTSTETFELSSNASTSIVHVTYASNRVTTRERKLLLGLAFLIGIIGGIWGMTLEFSVASFFNVLAGIGVLVASLFDFRRFARVCSTPNIHWSGLRDPENPAPSTSVHDLGNDNDGEESESDFEDPVNEEIPQEGFDHHLTNLRDSLLEGLKETLLEDLRKTLMRDLRKTLMKDLRKTIMRDLKKTLMKDLKKALVKDLRKAHIIASMREDGFEEHGTNDESCENRINEIIIERPDESIIERPDESMSDKLGERIIDGPDESCDDRPERPDQSCDDAKLEGSCEDLRNESPNVEDVKSDDISLSKLGPARRVLSRDTGSFDLDTIKSSRQAKYDGEKIYYH